MNGRVFSFGSSGNPLVQILSFVAFGAVLVVALIMGAVVIAVLFGLAAIFAAVIGIRVWWSRRQRGTGPPSSDYGYQAEWPEPDSKVSQKRLIEGEYEVVKKPGAKDTPRPQ
jgi:uncharacterized iron-regulated membrane protein